MCTWENDKCSPNYFLAETFDSLHFINLNLKFAHKYYSRMFKLTHGVFCFLQANGHY